MAFIDPQSEESTGKREGYKDVYAKFIALKKFYSEEDMKLLGRSTGIVYNALY
ncbi:MAG: hypothetical protein ABRQ38_02625 [Candidatus Eremiobacterota bacterium]